MTRDDNRPKVDPAYSPTIDESEFDPLAATRDASTAPASGAIAPGSVIDDQFRIERMLGQGGMGAVYLARDLQLDRDVALKLGKVVSSAALRRIEREAIALAKLQHPNVVVIHQVGKHEGRLYIAMEYVAGGNAREWRAAAPRTWREICLLYAAAGDGLAAAHAAGFVHRDFKPDNVLVGGDGRPRVADFGLVRAAGEGPDIEESMPPSSPSLDRMTQTGTVLGTPAYMAPEQFAGGAIDARTDQFALCASLWEALFDERAYAGTTPDEIKQSIEDARVAVPEATRNVPRRLVAALRRGLSRDRDARWPSLAPLIAELRRDPARRRRMLALFAGVALAGGAAVAIPLSLTREDPCGDSAAQIEQTWSTSRAHELAAAFERGQLAASWPSVQDTIDHYASDWSAAHRSACRATRVVGSQSETILDQRMLCLERARAELDLVLDSFAKSRSAAANAALSLNSLYDLARCSDVVALAQQTPLPRDPVQRASIEAAAKLVDRASLEAIEGWGRDTTTLPSAALTAARATQWPPLVAQAQWVHASYLHGDQAFREYRGAIAAALAAGDDRTAAWALADGAWELADSSKPAEAETWIDLSRALWERLGKPADLGNRIEGADAERLVAIGDPVGAIAAVRRANELGERAYPNNQWDRAEYHFNLARAMVAAGRIDDAQKENVAAIELATRLGGDHHPILIPYYELGGAIEHKRGRVESSIAMMRRALAVAERWYGASDPRVASSLDNLGQELALAGNVDEARGLLERAAALDPDDRHSSVSVSLTMLEAQSGHHARAIELGTATLAKLDTALGANNVGTEPLVIALAISHRELGHFAEAERYLRRAIDVDTAAVGVTAPQTINAKIEMSYALVGLHRAGEATKLLEPALAIPDVPPPIAAELHVAYGKALAEVGDRATARREVEQGRAAYAALGEAFAAEIGKADAWLHAHP